MSTSFKSEEASKELVQKPITIFYSLASINSSGKLVPNLERVIDIARFSTWIKFLRVTALVFKFIEFAKRTSRVPDTNIIDANDLIEAEMTWIRVIQNKCFSEEGQNSDILAIT